MLKHMVTIRLGCDTRPTRLMFTAVLVSHTAPARAGSGPLRRVAECGKNDQEPPRSWRGSRRRGCGSAGLRRAGMRDVGLAVNIPRGAGG